MVTIRIQCSGCGVLFMGEQIDGLSITRRNVHEDDTQITIRNMLQSILLSQEANESYFNRITIRIQDQDGPEEDCY